MIAWRYYISIIYLSYDRSILYLQDERDLFMKVLNLEKRFASNWLELLTAYPCKNAFLKVFLDDLAGCHCDSFICIEDV